jgi:hypothetical protein
MRLFLLLITTFFLFTSCKKYKPADTAFFIRASDVSVTTNKPTQGSGSNKITDLFLYIDGKFQGAYPVGNLMPVVTKNNSVRINLFAGIKNNGISKTRISWNFYDFLQLDTLVESGKSIDRSFRFSYNPNTKFEWIEDFDSSTGVSILNSSNSSTSYSIASAADSFEGKSLELSLTQANTIAQVESSISYSLPIGSSNVYLELNYKCNQNFEVGLFGGPELKPALNINAQESWNKIYVQLSNAVSNSPVYSTYKVYFKMVKTTNNPNPKLFLDNIKLIRF